MWKLWKTHHNTPQSTTPDMIITKFRAKYKRFYKNYKKIHKFLKNFEKNLPIDTVRRVSQKVNFFHKVFQSDVEKYVELCTFGVEMRWKRNFCIFLRCGKCVDNGFFTPIFHTLVGKKKNFRRESESFFAYISSFSISATPAGKSSLTSSLRASFSRTTVELTESNLVSEMRSKVSAPKWNLL